MTANFNIGLDSQGKWDFSIEPVFARKYNHSFGAGTETWLVLEEGDRKAIFLPTPGANYSVSASTVPAFPSDAPMIADAVDIIQNPAALQLQSWISGTFDEKRLYIQSPVVQTMTILIYAQPN